MFNRALAGIEEISLSQVLDDLEFHEFNKGKNHKENKWMPKPRT